MMVVTEILVVVVVVVDGCDGSGSGVLVWLQY